MVFKIYSAKVWVNGNFVDQLFTDSEVKATKWANDWVNKLKVLRGIGVNNYSVTIYDNLDMDYKMNVLITGD